MPYPTRRTALPLCVLVILYLGAGPSWGRPQEDSTAQALKLLTLEELMDIEITSVSGSIERLRFAAAAVSVVTNEDIRRTGATTIPEAMRTLPGIHVARRNANSWAVSSRGFSSVNSEKLLVLSDTRSIYTPLFSGVFWDVQDYIMEDIDRIEVIRGPGATLWGSNAVNGVINITTKHAGDTQGLYLDASGGNENRAIVSARYGGRLGTNGFFRVFGKYSDHDDSFQADAVSEDGWKLGHAGFRADWDLGSRDAFTLQGDVYRGDVGQYAPAVTIVGRQGPQGDLNVRVSGGNILGNWKRTVSADQDFQVRMYYDRTHRNDPSFLDDLHTLDMDLRHRSAPWARHELIWGVNYRYTDNRNLGKVIFSVDPPSSRDHALSAFVQDQVAIHDRVRVTVGTKIERNDFSGFEVQPGLRAAWDVSPDHSVWGSVARAVRVPTRLERDIAIDVTDPAGSSVARLLGNRDFESEELMAYEAGYRRRVLPSLFLDLAVFHNRYERLASLELGETFPDPRTGQTVIPIVNRNLSDAAGDGVEAQLNYSPLEAWRLTASHAWLNLDIQAGGQDLNRGVSVEGAAPRHQFGLRSYLDLPGGWQLDAALRSLSRIRSSQDITSGEGIPGYSELDVRIAWRTGGTELSLTGNNLLHEHHVEFGSPEARGAIERAVRGKITWSF